MFTAAHLLIHLRDNYICQICEESFLPPNAHFLHVDHIFPKSFSFLSHPYNLQTLCSDCNWDKSNFIDEAQPVMIANAYERSNKYWDESEIDQIWDFLSIYFDDYFGLKPPGLEFDLPKEFQIFGKTIDIGKKIKGSAKEIKKKNFVQKIVDFFESKDTKYLIPIFDYCLRVKEMRKVTNRQSNREKIIREQIRSMGMRERPMRDLLKKTYQTVASECDDIIVRSQIIDEYEIVKQSLRKRDPYKMDY